MFAAQHVSYEQTGSFTQVVTDYLNSAPGLRPFFAQPPTLAGIEKTIERKQQQPLDRQLLVQVLKEQYASVDATEAVMQNIESLLSPQTFTVTTAHQPNLFTGPLYFMYKIIHAIKLAHGLKEQLPAYHFVPVYYMGSEDADFAELNHTYVDGKKIEWKKEQKGAVGRMTVDASLLQLINELEGQLIVEANGQEVIGLLRQSYTLGKTIQQATFELVHHLYGQYGLVVLIPDQASLKASMRSVFSDDLFLHTPLSLVQQTSSSLEAQYGAQAHPREINLFYLKDDVRERIIAEGEGYAVFNTGIRFTRSELEKELEEHPERFSPNVILRGLYQETILPNIAFVGGGGELAYWLQLKDLFDHYGVVYPVLVLRNSYLVIEKKWKEKIDRMQFNAADFFLSSNDLMNIVVERHAGGTVSLNGNLEKALALYDAIGQQAGDIDPTLAGHVAAIKARSVKYLQELEKKMLRAEKRKHGDQQRGIETVKTALFPGGGLQERKENFSRFYARWGHSFIDALYKEALGLEQQFTILLES